MRYKTNFWSVLKAFQEKLIVLSLVKVLSLMQAMESVKSILYIEKNRDSDNNKFISCAKDN